MRPLKLWVSKLMKKVLAYIEANENAKADFIAKEID